MNKHEAQRQMNWLLTRLDQLGQEQHRLGLMRREIQKMIQELLDEHPEVTLWATEK